MKAILQVILAIVLVMLVWGLVKWFMALAFVLLWKVAMIAIFVGLVYMVIKAMNRQKVSW